MSDIIKTIIIGGGAAGLIAAWQASVHGADVVLLEKNKKPGIKILISGGGKCNITNGNSIQVMLRQFEKDEARFLKYPFHEFTNTALLSLLKDEGVESYTRENGKVFPLSHNADDVVNALLSLVERTGVAVRAHCAVRDIIRTNEGRFSILTDNEVLSSDSVVVATGGLSYQKTGTTGDGFRWLQRFGHTIVPLRPALAPILLDPTPPVHWQGTPIRDCLLTAECGNKRIADWHGDVLFTHFGISGPAALEISKRTFVEFEQGKMVTVVVDFFPEHTEDSLDELIMQNMTENKNRNVSTLTGQFIPHKLAEYLLHRSEIDGKTKLHQLKKDERRRLVRQLKRCPVGTVKDIPIDRGEVTAGGVSLQEVSPTTMESALIPGLFLCGEILDIAGPVGGYNLQAAFSTGYVAGKNAATFRGNNVVSV